MVNDQVRVNHGATYLLLAPRLRWSDDGELTYGDTTLAILTALQTGEISGELVFEDRDAMVQVYRLEPLPEESGSPSGGTLWSTRARSLVGDARKQIPGIALPAFGLFPS
jgi:hypothetical protein